MAIQMAASHAVGRKLIDPIFEANAACKEAIKKFGADKVTNATIGTVLDESGNLSVMPTVEKVFRSMSMAEFMSYAPISGRADFIDLVKQKINCGGNISAIATAGGTGAIHHAIANYAERGDKVLTSDWRWGTYDIICNETGKKLETFQLFDNDYTHFNIDAFSAKVEEILSAQNSLLIILNTPAHNPTGYALSDGEWDKVLDVIKTCASGGKKITLLVDIAYIDFAGAGAWNFLSKFENLPENILILVAMSMSKSFTLYGQRTGALIAISASNEIISEFNDTNKYSSRATWSNINHGAQVLFTKINSDENLRADLAGDQKILREMVNSRAEVFVNEAASCGLKIVPYKGGFFIAVPAENPKAVCQALQKDLIFAVPLKLGIRVAACSTPFEKISGVATKIKSAIDAVK